MSDVFPDDPEPLQEEPRRSGLITTFGVLNLIFGFLCGCVGLGYGVFMLMMPGFLDLAAKQAIQQHEARRGQVLAQMTALQEQMDATPAEDPAGASGEGDGDGAGAGEGAQPTRAELQTELDGLSAQLARLDANSPAKPMQAMVDLMHGPAVVGSMVGFISIALVWNLGLIIGGFGLLGRRQWARTLTLGVSAFKILLEIGFLTFVMMAMPAAMEQFSGALPTGGAAGGGPTPAQFRQMMQVNVLTQGIFYSVAGCVYPAVLLIVLLTRGVRAEFADWALWRGGDQRG